jgi:hypothetical protein
MASLQFTSVGSNFCVLLAEELSNGGGGWKAKHPLEKGISSVWSVKIFQCSSEGLEKDPGFSVGVVNGKALSESKFWPSMGFDQNGWGFACCFRWGFVHFVHNGITIKKIDTSHRLTVGDEFVLSLGENMVLGVSLNGEDMGSLTVPSEDFDDLYPACYCSSFDRFVGTVGFEVNFFRETPKPARR